MNNYFFKFCNKNGVYKEEENENLIKRDGEFEKKEKIGEEGLIEEDEEIKGNIGDRNKRRSNRDK